MTLNADKNLGPAILEREECIKSLLQQHILDENTHERVKEENALKIIYNTKKKALQLINDYKEYISEDKYTYFITSFAQNSQHPQFYGAPKVHKNKVPVPMRPVVSQCGSIFAVLSIFIDFKLQNLTKTIPSYLKNSTSLLDILDKLDELPPSAQVFTPDTTSMYLNIDPKETIPVLEAYLREFGKELGNEIREELIELIMELTKLVMENNEFQFGSTWWKQIVDTAMGTTCAFICEPVFFSYFERHIIIPNHKKNLPLYWQQIDDIFAIRKQILRDQMLGPNSKKT